MNAPNPDTPPGRRCVAIVGRPNVGKSALFNRLSGRRVAVVHEQSGVTRDRLTRSVDWHGRRFDLIDTGGLGAPVGPDPGGIEAAVREQVLLAIRDAGVILLVVDVTAGLVPLDLEVAALLQRGGRPVIVAANKADHPGLDAQALDFALLGLPVYPISCLHARGVDEMMRQVMALLPDGPVEQTPEALTLAVAGRPNVGKSSFINRLLREERLIVSEVPGTTRDSIEVLLNAGPAAARKTYRLLDTAGMRKTARVREAVEKFSVLRTMESIRHADLVLLMLDASQGPTDLDRRIARMAIDHQRGLLVVVNKWDLAQAEKVTQRQYRKALLQELPFLDFAPIVFVSAHSGYNVRQALAAVDQVAAQLDHQVPTGVLNRMLQETLQRVSLPVVAGKKLKFYYAAQTGVRPPRVTLFTNSRKPPPAAFRAYLVRSLRAAFGWEGVPLILQFRPRRATRNGQSPEL